jgi:hypothetical protein
MLSIDDKQREVASPVPDLSGIPISEITVDFSDSAIARILGKSLTPPVPVAAFSSSI